MFLSVPGKPQLTAALLFSPGRNGPDPRGIISEADLPPASMQDGFLVAFGGHPGAALEGDAKTVDALVAAHPSQGSNFVAGFREQFFGAFDANALQFLPGRAPDVFQKCLVHSASGHGGNDN
jgi:hypothetical protein